MATYPALTRKLSRKWDRHAPGYDRMSEPMEHMLGFAQARARLFAGLSGTILELGVGTGRNLPYYPQDTRMIALDLSRGMLERAAYKARAHFRAMLPSSLAMQRICRSQTPRWMPWWAAACSAACRMRRGASGRSGAC